MEGKARTKRGGQGFLLSMMPVLLLAVALLLAWPLFSGGADAYAETDYVIRVDLETTFEIPERIPVGGEVPLVYADPGCIQVTAVESTYETATPGDFMFEWGEAGWYGYDPEGAEFQPYQEDTNFGTNFYAGENRFVIPLLINEDADVKFSSSCQYYLNGQRMEVDKYYNSLMQDVDLHLSVYDKDVIREVYLRGQTEDPWTGLTVVQPGMTVKKVIAKSGRIANDTVSVNTAKSGWQYGNSSDKYFYHNGDTFTEGSAWLQVDLWTADSSGDYIFTDDTKVYLNASEYDYDYLYVKLWEGDPVVSDGSNCVAYQHYSVHDPEISASVCLVDGSGWDSCGKVSIDGSDWHGNVADNYALGSSATIYAQAQEGYQFLEWRRRETNGEVVGTTNPLTVAVSGPERYYAIFEPVVPATGHLNSTVDYSFDEATGTLTLIPTEDDGEGGKTGTADSIGYGLSPFKGNQKIKHVVVREGIRVIGQFVFQDNNAIQTVELPASLRGIEYRAFEECRMVGDGFTVAAANETFKAIDGSLFSWDGEEMLRFVQKPGQTAYAIPDGVKRICPNCFVKVELDTLTLRGEGLQVQSYGIDGGTVKRFVVMEGVECIGYMAPLHTETVLGLPASLQDVDPQGTFLGSEYLTKINVALDGEVYQSLDGVLFDEQSIYSPHLSLTKYPAARAGTSYTVPLGVTRIGRFAFDSPKYLQEITLSKYVTEIDRDAFWYMTDATVTVMNPDATFDYDAFEYCSDITIKGYIGSTAQVYAQKMGFNFISIGENLGKLATPTNLGWDGTFATWDPVENAARYDLKFYRWDANNERWDHVSDHDVSVTDGSNRFDYDELLWYQDQRYYFTVTASCTQYESSDPAASPETVGRYSQGTYDPEIADDVLRIPYEPEAGYDYLEMRLMIYDETDNCVVSSWISGNTWNLRGILGSYSYGRYRVETELCVSHKGWTLDVATQAAPVYYDYQPVPAIDELSIVIPLPQEGLPWAKAEGLKVWAYADSVPYAAAERTDSEYNDCYVYQKEGSYVWNDFEPQGTVSLDKARYGYYLQVYTRPGFKFADEIKVQVNGSEEDVEILGYGSTTVILRYDFGGPMPSFGSEPEVLPEATVGESYSTVITYTGDYTISGMVGGEWDHFVPGFLYNVREGEMEFSGVAEKAGTYTFEMVAIQGHLSVTKTFTIKVNPGSIAKASVTGITDKTYTGAALKQSPKVVLDGKTLKAGTDYSLSYKNNTDAGTATLIIKGKGAYAGSIEKTFTIKPAALTKVTVKTASYTYDGKAKKPALTVQADKLTVAADGYTAAYAKNINAGTATVTVTGKGNFTGKVKATFKIVPAKVKVPTAKTGLTYTGASQTGVSQPAADKAKYTLTGNTGTKASTYTAKATLKDVKNYVWADGKTTAKSVKWTIAKADLKNAKVTGLKEETFTGAALKPAPVVKMTLGGKSVTLKAGTDYTVTYKNNTNPGTATVTIKGAGNFTGTLTKTFTIKKAQASFERAYGDNRFQTSLKIADQYKAALGVKQFDAVCIADGYNFPDALAGAYFAAANQSPIIVIHKEAPAGPNTAAAIAYIKQNLKPGGNLYILGGTGSVPESIEKALKAAGFQVTRLWGANRYTSNLEILKAAHIEAGTDFIVCTGADFADALSASATGKPVLLVAGNALTADQKAYLSGVRAKSFTVIGDSTVIADGVVNELKAYAPASRLTGATIYDRSVAIARKFFPGNVVHVNLADGRNFPDALCGGPLASKLGGPLLLTDGSQAVNGKLQAYAKQANTIKATVYGGPASVSDATVKQILSMN